MKRILLLTMFVFGCSLLGVSLSFGEQLVPRCVPGEKWYELQGVLICVPAKEFRNFPDCTGDERLCQVSCDQYVCVNYDQPCPDPISDPPMPDCTDEERLCQVSCDRYVCVTYGQPCPDPY